jgi:hypothetical protein
MESDTEFACVAKEDLYIEVPIGNKTEAEVQLAIDDALLQTALSKFKPAQCRDDVYCDKQIVRQDYSTGTTEAQLMAEELQASFPDYQDWLRWEFNMIGRYTPYREPYANGGLSFYNFGQVPSEKLLLEFGTSYPTTNLMDWYGLKFDSETKEIMLKVVFKLYDGETLDLPYNDGNFYAATHSQDGTTSDWVDYYAYATPKLIREFCADKGLSYPLPPTTHTDCDVVWCWGFVFNKDTLEYGPVKAYARYNQEAS